MAELWVYIHEWMAERAERENLWEMPLEDVDLVAMAQEITERMRHFDGRGDAPDR